MTEAPLENAGSGPATDPELSEDQLDDVAGGDIEITRISGFPEHLA